MKIVSIIVMMLLTTISYGQEDTCISKLKLIKFATEIRNLRIDTAIYQNKIKVLETENQNVVTLYQQEQAKTGLYKQEVDIYKDVFTNVSGIDFGKKRNTNLDRTLYFVGGVVVGVLVLVAGASIVKAI